MKLFALKFANGLYLERQHEDSLTSDLNAAAIYSDPQYMIYGLESIKKEMFPGVYKSIMEAGCGSYDVVEVKIVEA